MNSNEKKEDLVNARRYGLPGGSQFWDMLPQLLPAEQVEGFMKGNILKYVLREEHKGGVVDLKKAGHYLNKLVEMREAEIGRVQE